MPAQRAPAWSAQQVSALQRKLRGALAASALVTSGVAVVDADARPLFLRRARTPMTPASTFKLLVAAAALDTFGPGYRFETSLEALDSPNDGPLAGDLYLVGTGDPTLRSSDLIAGAGRVAAAGAQRITGAVIADASAFGGPEVNAAWVAEDLKYGYAAGTSALSVDEGTVEFGLVPTTPGAPARIEIRPPNSAVRITGSITTSYATALSIDRAPDENTFTFDGRIAAGAEQSYWRPVIDLARYAAGIERSALVKRGIDVIGGIRSGLAPLGATILWRHRSAPLSEILTEMLHESNNHYADSCCGRLERALRPSEPSNPADGRARLLRRLAVPDSLRMSMAATAPSDRIAPPACGAPRAHRALPQGRVHQRAPARRDRRDRSARGARPRSDGRARSGIEDVNALAGYVQTHSHGRVAFAILVNDRRADDGPVETGIDRVLDVLAAE